MEAYDKALPLEECFWSKKYLFQADETKKVHSRSQSVPAGFPAFYSSVLDVQPIN
jgi:hypothetical protein